VTISAPNPQPTLLTYALSTQPNPLQVGGPSQLVLAVSNGTGARVACQQIAVTLPVGTNANDLIATATVTATPPAGWTADVQGGLIVFAPIGGSVKVQGAGLVFELAVTVNGQPGTANVTIAETAASTTQPSATRTVTLPVAKFPPDFTLSPLLPVPSTTFDIPYGEPAQLNWTATGAGVTCTLTYQAADGGPMVSEKVPNTGPYTTGQPIQRSSEVLFTLIAQMAVPGQDNPMIVEQQLALTVDTLSLDFTAEPVSVGVNGLVRLAWDGGNATSCTLDAGPALPATGAMYVVLAGSRSFSMTATGPHGQSKTVQCSVTVDPTIVATQPVIGAIGQMGTSGQDEGLGTDATPGGPGGDIDFALAIAPLDTAGRARVIEIQVIGGTGGPGGSGNDTDGTSGGPGGNATAELSFDPALAPPAQYILNILPGPGGKGGQYWPQNTGPSGAPGSAALTIDGIPIPLP
jgi:hypothetical protein